jgi:hypothetical protein
MTNWQPLLEIDLVEGQDWVISSITTALEFRLEQTNIPTRGLFAIAQVLDPITQEFLDARNIPAKDGSIRLVLNPLQYKVRQIGLKYRYAEWPGDPQPWHVTLYHNVDVTESANPVSLVVDVVPRLVGAEPLGAAEQAKAEAIAEAERLISLIPQSGGNFDPAGAADQAKAEAIAEAERLISLIPQPELNFDPAGAAEQAKVEAIAEAERLISLIPQPELNFDPAGSANQAKLDAIAEAKLILPNRFYRPWDSGRVLSGSKLILDTDTVWAFGSSWFQSPGELGDCIEFEAVIRESYGLFTVEGAQAADCGQQTIFVDYEPWQVIDWYAGSTVSGIRWGEDMALSAGLHNFRFKITGKNEASSGFNAKIFRIQFQPF